MSEDEQVPNIFRGDGLPHSIENLPDAPLPRQFNKERIVESEGRYRPGSDEIRAVNNALLLRRPLLITGEPGKGKSSLAYAVAHELQLGSVLFWPITSRSTLQQGLYYYDSIGHYQEISLAAQKPAIELFIQLGPLGTALIDSRERRPRVLLIDEIDRCDIDLLHDLLIVLEEGEFEIPELARLTDDTVLIRLYQNEATCLVTRGRVQCKTLPLVFLTSDGEREFPTAFERFCLKIDLRVEKEKPMRNRIFVSYSHRDIKAFNEFKTMMAPAIRKGIVDIWDDTKMAPGAKWREEIEKALASAKVAVLLVSHNFLDSKFIAEYELPQLLKAAEQEGVTVFWIYLSPCLYQETEIAKYHAAHDVANPLDKMRKPERQAILSEVCAQLIRVAESR
jgi:MoxR-like ATPase